MLRGDAIGPPEAAGRRVSYALKNWVTRSRSKAGMLDSPPPCTHRENDPSMSSVPKLSSSRSARATLLDGCRRIPSARTMQDMDMGVLLKRTEVSPRSARCSASCMVERAAAEQMCAVLDSLL